MLDAPFHTAGGALRAHAATGHSRVVLRAATRDGSLDRSLRHARGS